MYVGHDAFSPAYRILTKHHIILRQDVIFDETNFGTYFSQDVEFDERDIALE